MTAALLLTAFTGPVLTLIGTSPPDQYRPLLPHQLLRSTPGHDATDSLTSTENVYQNTHVETSNPLPSHTIDESRCRSPRQDDGHAHSHGSDSRPHATTEGSARHSEDPTPLPPRVSHTGRQTLWRSRLFVPSMSAQAVTMRTRRRQDLSRTEADPSTLHMQETTSRSAPERTDTTCACPSMRPWDPQTLGIPERRCMCAERHTRNYDASCCTWFQMTDRSASQENTGLDSARFSPSRE